MGALATGGGGKRWSLLLLLFSGWRGPHFVTSAAASILVVVWCSLVELDFCRGNHFVDAGDFCFSAHLNAQRREDLSVFFPVYFDVSVKSQ